MKSQFIPAPPPPRRKKGLYAPNREGTPLPSSAIRAGVIVVVRAYDKNGTLLKKGTNNRIAGVPLEQPVQRLTIGVAGGLHKREAILAALKGKLINGLITDEAVAESILQVI